MKDFVISHIKDNDGLSPIIFMYLLGREFDYKLLDISEVEEYMNLFLEQDLSIYQNIYITDLTLKENIYQKLENSIYKDKVKVFDHHASHLFAKDKTYVTIDTKVCASALFYEYLKKTYDFGNRCTDRYVNLVNSLDLYTFLSDGNAEAPYLSSLLTLYGVDTYISKMIKRLQEPTFSFDAFEKQWFHLEAEKQKDYFEKKKKKMFLIEVDSYKGGVVFAENYRNELAHFLLDTYDDLDFVACINPQGGVSLRSNDKMDLSTFAKKYDVNGGGHKSAAGFAFPLSLQEKIIKELFFDAVMIHESK